MFHTFLAVYAVLYIRMYTANAARNTLSVLNMASSMSFPATSHLTEILYIRGMFTTCM